MTRKSGIPASQGQISVLLAVCLAALVLPLSFSGAAMATHAIGQELGGSTAARNWITNSFMLTFGSFLMTAGALSDVFGRKRIFLSGVTLFALASFALSVAPSLEILNALRAVQGLAAAAALAGGSAALAQEFEGHARTRAFSMIGTTFGLGLAFGPILSGFLIESLGWRSIFLSGTLIGALSLLIAIPRMRESKNPDAAGFDWYGAATFTAMLSLLTFALIEGPANDWTSLYVLALLVGAAASLAAFVLLENRVRQPLLDLSLFRYARFVGVQVLPIATTYSYVVLLILLPLRFVGIEGYSEIEAGLLMLALSAPMLVVPLLAATLARRIAAGTLAGTGLLIAAAGLFYLSRIEIGAHASALVAPLLLIGIGAGMPWGLMDGLSITVVPKERAGMATGIFNTTKVAGEGITLAMVNAILAAFASSTLQHAMPDGRTTDGIGEAARHLATGDLSRAADLLPGIAPKILATAYGIAFDALIYVLITITLLAAAVVFGLLGNATAADEEQAETLGSPAE
ncbi:MFS transporter [Rhizobium sp. BK251]|uniref:MFS transporter n=1 Tax=Rhizobium sp. BK251 TaxID=2512125 RepID=UPI00104F304E|nr:MFS transporter [Rhizobium sp. BK251]TCL71461.1 EmrB/QacA subfamily drug resistance transporter [Rhizobium sp. BK251]